MGLSPSLPCEQGRWHFRKKMTEGLLLTSLSSFCSLRSISQSLSLAFARQLPLHKGAFDTIKFCPCFLFVFSSSAEPLLNHATIAWFSYYNKRGHTFRVRPRLLFIVSLGRRNVRPFFARFYAASFPKISSDLGSSGKTGSSSGKGSGSFASSFAIAS